MVDLKAIDCPPETVPLKDIEKELLRQLQAGRSPHDPPSIQARMSNLIVYCEQGELADRMAKEIPAIVRIHPARVILLVADPNGPTTEISASVSSWCRIGSEREKICSDQITLTAGGRAVDRLSFAVRRLIIGDLPINFWWTPNVPPSSGGMHLYDLVRSVQQVIYDSIGWPEPAKNVVATAAWLKQIDQLAAHSWCVASDINWRRLRDWRRTLAQSLDPVSAPGAMDSITEVQVEHGPHAVVQAWQLSSWLARGLNWRVQGGKVQVGQEISWVMNSAHGDLKLRIKRLEQGTSEVHRVRIACKLHGTPVVMNISLEAGPRLAVALEGVVAEPRTITVQTYPLAELIGRQLSDRVRDPAFQAGMEVAGALAKCLIA